MIHVTLDARVGIYNIVHISKTKFHILDLVTQNLTKLVLCQLSIEFSWIGRWGPVNVGFLEKHLLLSRILHV